MEDIISLAYAPIKGDAYGPISGAEDDINKLCRSLDHLQRLSNTGFKVFYNEIQKCENTKSDKVSSILKCLQLYFVKLKGFIDHASKLNDYALEESQNESSYYLQQWFNYAEENGLQPENEEIKKLFDTNSGSNWEFKTGTKKSTAKVNFRRAVSVLETGDDDFGSKKTHKPMRDTFVRSSNRQQTGFSHFNYRDLLEKEIAAAQEQDEEVDPKSTSDLDQVQDTNTNATQSFWQQFCCVGTVNDQSIEECKTEPVLTRRYSSVSLGSVEEIKDKVADTEWNQKPRHDVRAVRIRKRIPTGHPALMKASSLELMTELELDDDNEK